MQRGGPEIFFCGLQHVNTNDSASFCFAQEVHFFLPSTKHLNLSTWKVQYRTIQTANISHNGSDSMTACLLSTPSSSSPNSMSASSCVLQPSLSSSASSFVISFLLIAKLCSTQYVAIIFCAFSGLLISRKWRHLKRPFSLPIPRSTTLRIEECTLL